MSKKNLLLWVLLGWFSSGLDTQVYADFTTPIRVLLDRESRSVEIKSQDDFLLARWGKSMQWKKLKNHLSLRYSLKKKPSPIFFKGGMSTRQKIYVNGKWYRGLIKLTPKGDSWMVTNIVNLEDYLAGNLAAEMNASWNLEALKAQAVASRTYAKYMADHPKHAEYDLEKGTSDQVYRGVEAENVRALKAIKATAGEILREKNKVVKIFYHSRCGGHTDNEMDVWNAANAKHAMVPCPYCQKHPLPWETTVDLSKIRQSLSLPRSQRPLKIAATQLPSGRLGDIHFISDSKIISLPSDTLRSRLGYSNLKSTLFRWKVNQDSVTFQGTGRGHGVGMCQWGAQHLAKTGKSYRQILTHYYPRFELHHQKHPRKIPLKKIAAF